MITVMKNLIKIISAGLLWAALCQSTGLAMKTEIELAARKDLVLTPDSRRTVLKIADKYLDKKDEEFAESAGALKSPFRFKQPTSAVPAADGDLAMPEEVPVQRTVVYDDASVLEAAASSFAKQVRGALARGETSFLQIQGGSLIKAGASFPVRIPQVGDQSFTLTIVDISSDGYTLKLGEATKQIRFNDTAPSNSIQFNN